MAFDVVTAKQGKPHVTADQQALMQAGMLGKGRYALDALNNLACTMTDSNTLTVDTGGLMVDGRWVVNEAQTSFTIANGSQAQFRKDLAALEITVDPSTGVTSLEEKVLQGATAATEAAAADPTYDPGDLYTGLTAVVPIARITLDGLTPTCEALLPSVADLKTISEQTKKLGDSVSPKTLVDGQIKSGESRTVHGIADWLMVGVYASAAAGDSDDREMLIPCLVGDRFLLGSSGCAVDGSNPRYVSVRFSLNGEVLKYVNVAMQDVENGNILNSRNANGVVGLIRR